MNKRDILLSAASSLCVFLVACSDGSSSEGDDVATEFNTLEEQLNAKAREACGAPENVSELESGDSDEAACYFELAVEFEPCERQALEANPEIAREVIACTRMDREALIACCETDGPCTYSSIETCMNDFEESDQPSACSKVDMQAVEEQLNKC
jgi:hypothetical protein